MRRTLTATIKHLVAATLLVMTIAATPLTAQAASADIATRTVAVATVNNTMMATLPEGTPYDNSSKYVATCTINGSKYIYTGYGCVGFALNFVENAFGQGGSYTKTEGAAVSSMEPGDIVRVPSATGGHSFVIVSMDETGATIAEANYNASVHYGRHVSNEDLAANLYVLHRI